MKESFKTGSYRDLNDLRRKIEEARAVAVSKGKNEIFIDLTYTLHDAEWMVASLKTAEEMWKGQ